MQIRCLSAIIIVGAAAQIAQAGPTWVDWTSIGGVHGTVDGVTVTATGDSVSIGSFDFDDGSIWTYTGVLEYVNLGGDTGATISFDAPVKNPVLQLQNLAMNELTFSLGAGQSASLLSSVDDVTFDGTVLTSMTDGGLHQGAGTIQFSGMFTSLSWTSNGNQSESVTRWAVGVETATVRGMTRSCG